MTVLTCRDDDQAKVLAYLLSGTPLGGHARSYQGASHTSAETVAPASPDQRNQSWNTTPQRRLLKCMIVAIDRQGARGLAVARKFKELVPNYQTFFERPVTDQAIIQRGDCARRYPNENPATNPKLKMYWPLAQTLVDEASVNDIALALKDPDDATKTMA